jgi:hypothetical protein
VTCSSPKSSFWPGPSNVTFAIDGATCGTPITCSRKSLNISFDDPETAWQPTQPALPKNSTAPRFSASVIAFD